ncbi:hypothetical protein DM790_25710 [Flavobacterium collinsii]|nr:hypothetical protein [Flavobacterium collinsii]
MKNSILLCCLLITALVQGQNDINGGADKARIILNAYVPDQVEHLNDIAKSNLENKLSQIATANGVGGNDPMSRFILTANVAVLSKDITPTAPPMYQYTIELTLYIGDGIEGTKFSSHSVTLKGAGTNETKAYMAALKNLKTNDAQYQVFVEKGKAKIVEYYSNKCGLILKGAQTLANQGQYEEAMYNLSNIPEVCTTCYDKSAEAIKNIYKQQIDREGKVNLSNAKNAWNSSPNASGASLAGEYLSQIDPNSIVYNEAERLSDQISKKMVAIEKKEWNFQMKRYNDEVNLQQQTLEAARAIGVAYAKNQPKTVYKISGWW